MIESLASDATLANALASDRAARRAARTVFDRPVVLEAGAGTGKTTTLVARVLTWSLGPGWERAADRLAAARPAGLPGGFPGDMAGPDRIATGVLGGVVAITFTEAAAAEMAGRVAEGLARLAAGDLPKGGLEADELPPAAERTRRARALLGTLDHLVVRTIHAFCRGLIAAWPVEAGRHPAFTVDADGRLLEGVVNEVVETALREAYGDPGDPHLLALATEGLGPPQIVEALLVLAQEGLPAAALADDPLDARRVGALRTRLAEAAGAVHGLLAGRLAGARAPLAIAVEEGVARLLGRLSAGHEPADLDLASLCAEAGAALPENHVARLKEWGKGRLHSAAEEERLGGIRDELAPACGALTALLRHLTRLEPELLGHARLALAPLLARVEREVRSRGVETFQGLLSGAAELLARHPEVAARVRRGIDQLLVDEFQDTDLLQCDLLRRLALHGPPDGPPEERPGLFLVGDPKQSIYGWRSADLRAYDGFVAEVRAAGGEVHALAENFRSVPAVLDEVERVVAPTLRARPGLQPPFVRLLPCAAKAASPGYVRSVPRLRRPVEHWASHGLDGAEAAEREAAALAADLLDLHATSGVAWREVGVLLRSTGDLDTYLEALRRAGIPYQVGRDRQYYRRREVIDAAALVRAVLDPGDHLALLTWLRSPAVGVPDAALVPLWSRGLPRAVTDLTGPSPDRLAALRSLIAEAAVTTAAGGEGIPGLAGLAGWELGLMAAVEQLAELRRSFAEDPADLFVERLRGLTLVEAIEAARYLGAYRLANLDRFFRQLRAALEEGDVTAVLRFLRRNVAAGQEAEEGRPKDAVEDAVSVLTIHGAKGLDFAHVYVLQLHKPAAPEPGPRTEVGPVPVPGTAPGSVEEPAEYRLFGAATPGWDQVEVQRERVEAAERVRLLYVAMTRAEERLVLAGSWPEMRADARGERAAPEPDRARSHADLLLHRLGLPPGGIAALRQAAVESGQAHTLDGQGVLWRFPELEAEQAGEPVPAWREGAPPPTAVEARQAGRVLAGHRRRAERRMARRWSAAASEEAHDRLREATAARRSGEPAEEQEEIETGDSRDPRDALPGVGRDARAEAMAAGGAVHRALETWDLAADPAAELARQRGRLPATLAALGVSEADRGRALRRARIVLEQFAAGPLLPRLRALRERIVARELPVLLPPAAPGPTDTGEPEGPVGFVAGAVDLLYRDPATGALVIADYKTDDVDAAGLPVLAAAYAPQGAAYVRAVRDALDLPASPRFELWFLRAGEVMAVEAGRRDL
ncbi:MAG TPA: UvrD-helicase domain-containing protein [Thermoanaerobaculia bacterium]|nr:UvrD-helicase domain-containing protein [Thermoanaerobaculia bacterium]